MSTDTLPEAVREQVEEFIEEWAPKRPGPIRRAFLDSFTQVLEAAVQQERARLSGAVAWWQEKLADGVTGQDAEDMLAAFASIAHPPPTAEDR